METVPTNSFSVQQSSIDDESPTFWEHIAVTRRWGRYVSEIERHAIEYAQGLVSAPTRALEVGCEGGRWSRMLADKGWQVVCTDVNRDSLRKCQARIPEARCVLVQPTDTTLPCDTGAVGLLLCIEVFPVIEGAWFPAEASRVLSDNGVLVGVFINKRSLRGAFVHSRAALQRQEAEENEHRLYTRSYGEWKQRLPQYSFEVVYEQGFCWFPFPRKSDSPLIPLCTRIESTLGLQKMTSVSPWIVFVARKI